MIFNNEKIKSWCDPKYYREDAAEDAIQLWKDRVEIEGNPGEDRENEADVREETAGAGEDTAGGSGHGTDRFILIVWTNCFWQHLDLYFLKEETGYIWYSETLNNEYIERIHQMSYSSFSDMECCRYLVF